MVRDVIDHRIDRVSWLYTFLTTSFSYPSCIVGQNMTANEVAKSMIGVVRENMNKQN